MRFQSSFLVALLAMSGTTLAATPAKPAAPAVPARPAVPPAAPVKADRAPTADEELALAALEGLMAQPPERALPILKKVLAGSQPPLIKQRALFVLSQLDSPEAQQILVQASRSSDAALRAEAIRNIGIGGDPKALDSLMEIYSAGNEDAKREVLQAWLIAGRKEAVYQAALNAKTEDETRDAIQTLGAMGATEELRKLGDRPKMASGLVNALAVSGDLTGLRKIAETNADHGVRIEAVRALGIIQNDASRTAVREIYTRSDDREIRDAALQAMLIGDDEQGVLALYRAAKSTDEKRSLLHTLSLIGGDAALQAIDTALEEKK
jgi:HEAT repeat protein